MQLYTANVVTSGRSWGLQFIGTAAQTAEECHYYCNNGAEVVSLDRLFHSLTVRGMKEMCRAWSLLAWKTAVLVLE